MFGPGLYPRDGRGQKRVFSFRKCYFPCTSPHDIKGWLGRKTFDKYLRGSSYVATLHDVAVGKDAEQHNGMLIVGPKLIGKFRSRVLVRYQYHQHWSFHQRVSVMLRPRACNGKYQCRCRLSGVGRPKWSVQHSVLIASSCGINWVCEGRAMKKFWWGCYGDENCLQDDEIADSKPFRRCVTRRAITIHISKRVGRVKCVAKIMFGSYHRHMDAR